MGLRRLGEDYGNRSVVLAGGPHGDLDILAERGQKVHQALDGKGSRLASHQAGDMRLLDAEQYPGSGLGEISLLDETVDFQREASTAFHPDVNLRPKPRDDRERP